MPVAETTSSIKEKIKLKMAKAEERPYNIFIFRRQGKAHYALKEGYRIDLAPVQQRLELEIRKRFGKAAKNKLLRILGEGKEIQVGEGLREGKSTPFAAITERAFSVSKGGAHGNFERFIFQIVKKNIVRGA